MNILTIRRASLFAGCVLLAAACGSGTVTFGSGDDDTKAKVTFKGNLDDVSPVTTRDIVVFVYQTDDDIDQCPCPPDPSGSSTGKAVVLTGGDTEFSITGLESGAFGVVFLLDGAGDAADGTIDPGDEIAILDDLDCRLDDVAGKLTVNLNDIDVLFDVAPDDDCRSGDPAPGRARADTITKETTAEE